MFTAGHGSFPGLVQRFYTPFSTNVLASQALQPALFDESVDTFFTPLVSHRLTAGLYTDTDTFFVPVVTVGSRTLTPSLYTDIDTFFTPVVTGRKILTPSLYTDVDTFFSATVTARKTLTPTLYTDADTFFAPTVTGRKTLTPGLYVDADTFFTPVVTQPVAGEHLTPNLYVDADVFFSPTTSVGGNYFDPEIYTSSSFFFASLLTGGSSELPSLTTGGRQMRHDEAKKFVKIEGSSDVRAVYKDGNNLQVKFQDGKVYNYFDVSDSKFNRLTKSRSPGGFLNNNIKGKHAYYRFH